jgi:hypothetical protein
MKVAFPAEKHPNVRVDVSLYMLQIAGPAGRGTGKNTFTSQNYKYGTPN